MEEFLLSTIVSGLETVTYGFRDEVTDNGAFGGGGGGRGGGTGLSGRNKTLSVGLNERETGGGRDRPDGSGGGGGGGGAGGGGGGGRGCNRTRYQRDPNTLQIIILTLVGLLMWSNLLVILVYRNKCTSVHRLCMMALSVADLVLCTQHLLSYTVDYLTDDPTVALATTFQLIWDIGVFFSLSVLVLIALGRYFATCIPTKDIMTLKHARRALAALLGLAVLEGSVSEVASRYRVRKLPLGIECAHWILCGTIVLFCYSSVTCVVYRRDKAKKRQAERQRNILRRLVVKNAVFPNPHSTKTGPSTSSTVEKNHKGPRHTRQAKAALAPSASYTTGNSRTTGSNVAGAARIGPTTKIGIGGTFQTTVQPSSGEQGQNGGSSTEKVQLGLSYENCNRLSTKTAQSSLTNYGGGLGATQRLNQHTDKGTKSKRLSSAARTNLMLWSVTILFFIFWIPRWLHELDGSTDAPCDVRDIFVLNSVVNAFVYSVFSPMFRQEVLKLFSKLPTL